MVNSMQTLSPFALAEGEGSCSSLNHTLFAGVSVNECLSIGLAGVVNLIVQAIPVGLIYNLGKKQTHPDLLVVLEKKCTKAYSEFENIIELAMLGFPMGTCTIHNYGLLNAQMQNGHLFYNSVCVPNNVIYQKNESEVLGVASEEAMVSAREEAAFLFNTCLQRAVNFYDGAQYYFQKGHLEMTMFMLHQACELTYRCLLKVLRGRDLKCHSLTVLRKHIRRFAPSVIGVFSEIEEEELYHLQLLEDAYTQARYEPNYSVDQDELSILFAKVGLLQEETNLIGQRL